MIRQQRYFKGSELYRTSKRRPAWRIPQVKPRADAHLDAVFARIGVPELLPFQPDPFQLDALEAIERADCLVTAPTGAGKTWIAEQAIRRMFKQGKRSWYASPLKALTNSKYAEFGAIFGSENVGILTGDRKEQTSAPIVVGTTEILRNQLYDAMHMGEDVPTDLVILDEAHFLGDPERGVVWEEVMIYLPARVPLLMLSATAGNADQIASWLESLRMRTCVVVEELRRPVDLCYLFLHPSGLLLPLLAQDRVHSSHGQKKGKLFKQVKAYADEKNPPLFCPPKDLPPFDKILHVLRQFQLLPAIFFLKSRADCDKALGLCELQDPNQMEGLHCRLGELLQANPHLARHPQVHLLENKAVGSHHAGQLPAWKLLLETLMTEGLLDAVFATSTVAAGVNFPARSVVFFNSDRFNGQDFVPLTATEFHQMTGRAGRRGMDNIGFAIAVPGPYLDAQAIANLTVSPPLPVLSQLKINFSMVLNLLLSHTPAQVEALIERSFATYLKGKKEGHVHKRLVRDLERHVAFLKQKGYVTSTGALTETGRWASQLRVDQPLLIAECLRRNLLPSSDPALLAAIIAAFVNEREDDEGLDEHKIPKSLNGAFKRVQENLENLAIQMIEQGFEVHPLFMRPAVTMHAWASGKSWESIVTRSKMAEGDLAMLISRTADNLRHISTLTDAFPRVAETASQAIESILREPVAIFDV